MPASALGILFVDALIARCRYHYTDLDSAKLVVDSIGLRASNVGQLGGGVSICLTSPVEMGWCKYGEGSFPEAVGNALWGSKQLWEAMPHAAAFVRVAQRMCAASI